MATLAVVGRVRAPSTASLGASVAGVVEEVHLREGDRAGAGQVVLTLDQREAAARVREAAAALAEAQANVDQAIDAAAREAELAARDLARIRSVHETGALTEQQVEQAEQRAEDARARLEALRIGVPGEGSEPASVARARAALEAARARLDLTRIRAPAAGVILTRDAEPGDAVSPGVGLLTMAVDGPVELVAFPGEETLSQLRVGGSASASADAFPEETFPAEVSFVAPVVDAAQGTVEIRLSVPDPPPYLRPDMTVSINVVTGESPSSTVLPEEAVQASGSGTPWIGVVQDGRFRRRDVEVGLRAEGFVEILSGVSPTDSVILDGDGLGEGERVRTVLADTR